jgi:hypothetical protein
VERISAQVSESRIMSVSRMKIGLFNGQEFNVDENVGMVKFRQQDIPNLALSQLRPNPPLKRLDVSFKTNSMRILNMRENTKSKSEKQFCSVIEHESLKIFKD